MRDPQGEHTPSFYQFAVWSTRLLLNLFSRWRVIGAERIPLRGPLLVVSNHQNNADPAILIAIMPRTTHMMAKQELFKGPIRLLSERYCAFPVRRGEPDRQALKTALEFLERGSCVGIFPEGTRSRTGGLIKAQLGVGLIAVRSGAPILPLAIVGTSSLRSAAAILRRPRIDIIVGDPFSIPRHEGGGKTSAAMAASEMIMRKIAALLPPDLHGEYPLEAVTSEQGGA